MVSMSDTFWLLTLLGRYVNLCGQHLKKLSCITNYCVWFIVRPDQRSFLFLIPSLVSSAKIWPKTHTL